LYLLDIPLVSSLFLYFDTDLARIFRNVFLQMMPVDGIGHGFFLDLAPPPGNKTTFSVLR
jgi:hypothetical protein